jgi:LacI family transcriptional regulator
MAAMKRVTLTDIAVYAGVSTAAVSYYFRGKKNLSGEVTRKIQEAAKLYDYTPIHGEPQGKPKNNRIVNMCLVLENKDISEDIYFLGMMNGVTDCLAEHGYHLLVSRLVSGDRALQDLFIAGLGMSAGVILCNPRRDHYFEDELEKQKIPYVLLGSSERTESAFYVDVDMRGVGFQSAEYFLAKGHKRILYLNLPELMLQSQQRLQGFALAYERRGLRFDPADHVFLPVSVDACYAEVKKRFLNKTCYTAVVTSNEIQGQGVIKALRELRIDIPSRVELSSMGGTVFSIMTVPSLTTIDFDAHKNGYEAARMLIDILKKKRITPFHMILPGNFVERDSTK